MISSLEHNLHCMIYSSLVRLDLSCWIILIRGNLISAVYAFTLGIQNTFHVSVVERLLIKNFGAYM